MSKLTGLHSIFRKKFNGANIGFHTLTFARSLRRWRCLKPRTTDLVVMVEHLISPEYVDDVLRSVILPFCANTSDSTRPRMTMSEHTSLESAKTMLCALTGQFAHWTCLPGRVAQSVTCLATDACLTADPGVASSIPARSHTFVEIDHEIISTVILLPSADLFKKGCCQLQAKVSARITGLPLVEACPGKSVVR